MSPVECSKCGFKTRDSWNLKRHEKSQCRKKAVGPFVCALCDRKFQNNYYLKRHIVTHEPRVSRKAKFASCRSCKIKFPTVEERDLHRKHCETKGYVCAYCNKRMRLKAQLSRHIQQIHLIERPFKIHCPLCSTQTRSMIELDQHLTEDHLIEVRKQDLQFDSKEAFHEWKEELESTTSSYYVKDWATSTGIQLECHRSGFAKIKPSDSRKRELKRLGSVKINAHCPARIRAKYFKDGLVIVHCVITHVGHDANVRRMPLSKQLRERLATAMSLKVPISDILSGFAGKTLEGQPSRDDFITRKDLHNIIRDFKVSKDGILGRKGTTTTGPKRNNNNKATSPTNDKVKKELDTRTYFAEYMSSNNPTSDSAAFILLEEEAEGIKECSDDVFTPEFEEIVFQDDQIIEELPAPNTFYADVKEELTALADRVEKMNPEQIEACYTAIHSLKEILSDLESPCGELPLPSTSYPIAMTPEEQDS